MTVAQITEIETNANLDLISFCLMNEADIDANQLFAAQRVATFAIGNAKYSVVVTTGVWFGEYVHTFSVILNGSVIIDEISAIEFEQWFDNFFAGLKHPSVKH